MVGNGKGRFYTGIAAILVYTLLNLPVFGVGRGYIDKRIVSNGNQYYLEGKTASGWTTLRYASRNDKVSIELGDFSIPKDGINDIKTEVAGDKVIYYGS